MKYLRKIFGIFLCLSLAVCSVGAESAEEYKVGPGDSLNISISLQGSLRDLSKISLFLPIQIVGESVYSSLQVVVGPDGYISIPSLEYPVRVAGLPLVEVENLVAVKLRLPSRGRSVSVSLLCPNSVPFFIWGEVAHPGRFIFDRPMTLMEGLSYAGGPTPYAQLKKVMVIRQNERAQIFNLSARKMIQEGPSLIWLNPSDTVIVPKKWTADMSVWFLVLTIIATAAAVKIASD